MAQTLIEKLEALPEYVGVTGEVFANDYVLIRLNKWKQFIEQAKAEQAEPAGYVDESGLFTKDPYEYPNKSFTPVFLNPQPTPQDILDAERYRFCREYREYWIYTDEAIDRAMKGAND